MTDPKGPITDLEIVAAVRHYAETVATARLEPTDRNLVRVADAMIELLPMLERTITNAVIEIEGRKAEPDGA